VIGAVLPLAADIDLSPGTVLGGVAAVLGGYAAVLTARTQARRGRAAAEREAEDQPAAVAASPELSPAIAAIMGAFQQQITELQERADDLQQKVAACEARDRRNVSELARLRERDRQRRKAIEQLRNEVERLRHPA
jgi:predicted RNase H-like nuclease (RuvC/YqgF family)